MKGQRGFSAVEGLLILVIVGLLSFVGWYVWTTSKKTKDSLDDTAKSSVNKANSEEKNETTGWKVYSSEEGKYSLKYPNTWATASNPEMCNEGTLLLGGNEQSVGACATDGGGQVLISSYKGDIRDSNKLTEESYPDLKTEEVTVDGVSGVRYSGTYKMPEDVVGIGPEDGEKTVLYIFYSNGLTYSAMYSEKKNYPDVLSDFDLMIRKTFKFNS